MISFRVDALGLRTFRRDGFAVGSPYGAALSIAGVWGEARQGRGQEGRDRDTVQGCAVGESTRTALQEPQVNFLISTTARQREQPRNTTD